MTKFRLLALVALAVFLVSSTAWAFAPTLRNRDSDSYDYTIECGGLTRNKSISGNTRTSLGQSSEGCTLNVEGAGSAQLEEDMDCEIEDGSLSCS